MADGPYPHGMGEQYARHAPFMEVQRRSRHATTRIEAHDTWINRSIDKHRCHMVVASTTVLIAVGATSPVTTVWMGDQFFDEAGNVIDYGVEILPTGLIGKGTGVLLSQTGADVTVNVTATLLIAIGTQFIVHGCSRLPGS